MIIFDRDEAKLFTNHELYLERSVLKQTDLMNIIMSI